MKICLAQLAVTASKAENLKLVASVMKGLEAGTGLVVFPEYVMGFPKEGLTRSYVQDLSETLEGEFVSEVVRLSKKKESGVILPIFERGRERVYNTAVVIDRGRVLGGYRKMKLFDALGYKESDVFGTGSGLTLFKVRSMLFGMAICYDIRFPELFRKQAMAGAEAVIVPAAWYKGEMKEEQWQTLLMARAHEDTCYVVGVGNANEAFIGRSMVASPSGIKALDLGAGAKVAYFNLDPREVTEVRLGLPVLKQSSDSVPACRIL